ncbi:MAG: hypothetical protein WC001_13595 [Desulfurivibrionaceae bacterium]
MKKIGTCALVIGLFGLLITFGMNTTVSSGGGDRVHNIGLMHLQQNLLFVFIAVAISGIVILVSNNRKTKSQTSSFDPRAIDKNQARRACPFCAEHILARAVVCRYCGRDVEPIETTPVEVANFPISSMEPTEFEILSNYSTATEDFMRRTYSSLKKTNTLMIVANLFATFLAHINRHINKIAAFLVVLGTAYVIFWKFFSDFSNGGDDRILFYRLEESASMLMAGLIIYFRAFLVKPEVSAINDGHTVTQTEPKASKSSVPFFGVHIDLIVFQMIVVLMIFYLHNNYYPKLAYILAMLASGLGYLLTSSGNKFYGMTTLFIAISYIVYRHLFFNEWNYIKKRFYYITEDSSYINMTPYLLIIMISIAIPHVQKLRFNIMRYGNLRGDITPTIMGHKVIIPFCSALVFYVLWYGILRAIKWTCRGFGYGALWNF